MREKRKKTRFERESMAQRIEWNETRVKCIAQEEKPGRNFTFALVRPSWFPSSRESWKAKEEEEGKEKKRGKPRRRLMTLAAAIGWSGDAKTPYPSVYATHLQSFPNRLRLIFILFLKKQGKFIRFIFYLQPPPQLLFAWISDIEDAVCHRPFSVDGSYIFVVEVSDIGHRSPKVPICIVMRNGRISSVFSFSPL